MAFKVHLIIDREDVDGDDATLARPVLDFEHFSEISEGTSSSEDYVWVASDDARLTCFRDTAVLVCLRSVGGACVVSGCHD